MHYNQRMKHIRDQLKMVSKKERETERGELMKYFIGCINPSRLNDGLPPVSMGRMGKLLQQIPTKDLYYVKTVCDDSANFSKKFWWLINPKNHTPEALAQKQAQFAANKSKKFPNRN